MCLYYEYVWIYHEVGATDHVSIFPNAQEGRHASVASIQQQGEIIRYLSRYNAWAARDVLDRQAEIRGVSARVDELRDMLMNLANQWGARVPQGAFIRIR